MLSHLYKYWVLLQASWQNQLAYRASVLLWRFRNVLGTFLAISVWSVVLGSGDQFFGYNNNSMITYIFLISIIQSLVVATALHGLANVVYSGQLSYHLLKPMNIFSYFAMEDLADKLRNFGFVLLETMALYLIFRPLIVFPQVAHAALLLLLIAMGITLNFIITLLFGAIGFWSNDVWGPKFLFFMFIEFTSGKFYPLDIMPTIVQQFFYLTPFPYLSYVQTQVFLGRYDLQQSLTTITIMSVWIIGLAIITKSIWRNGLKNYATAGN